MTKQIFLLLSCNTLFLVNINYICAYDIIQENEDNNLECSGCSERCSNTAHDQDCSSYNTYSENQNKDTN